MAKDTKFYKHPTSDYPPGRVGLAILSSKPKPKLSNTRYNQNLTRKPKQGDQLHLF